MDDRRWDSNRFVRERERRAVSRGPPVRERDRDRPRHREEERFEQRLAEEQRFGPLSRRPGRRFDADDHLNFSREESGPLVAYDPRRRPSSPPPPPRLLRRQSSLDTFLDQKEPRRRDRSPPMAFRSPTSRRPSVARHVERDEYEDIRIAEPEYYGDEEYRHLRDRDHDRLARRMRRRSTDELFREREKVVEKTYPRKGKTRMPRRLVHVRAVNKLGYPYVEEDDVIVIQRALSKEQIDDVVTLSRTFRERTESVSIQRRDRSPSPSPRNRSERIVGRRIIDSRSPRTVRDTLLVPSVHRARSQMRTEIIEKKEVQPRSVSVSYRGRRDSSPVRILERRDDRVDAVEAVSGQIVLAERPRRTDRDLLAEIRVLEDERRLQQQLERRDYNAEIIRDTTIVDSDGNREETVEIRKDRKVPNPRILRAMMATLT